MIALLKRITSRHLIDTDSIGSTTLTLLTRSQPSFTRLTKLSSVLLTYPIQPERRTTFTRLALQHPVRRLQGWTSSLFRELVTRNLPPVTKILLTYTPAPPSPRYTG